MWKCKVLDLGHLCSLLKQCNFSCFAELFLMILISCWSCGSQVQHLHLTLVGSAENVMAGVTCGSEGRIQLEVNIRQLWKGWAATGLSLDRAPRRQCCSPSDICDIWLEHSYLTLEILICLIKVLYVTNALKLHKGHPRNWGKRKIYILAIAELQNIGRISLWTLLSSQTCRQSTRLI